MAQELYEFEEALAQWWSDLEREMSPRGKRLFIGVALACWVAFLTYTYPF